MKKVVVICLSMLFIFFSVHSQLFAREDISKFFGVGADIKQINQGEYLVKTKGEKIEEGFVYTPKEKFTSKKIQYKIKLKGKGKHFLVIEETDARGVFIKEKKWAVELSNSWKSFTASYELKNNTSQIDVFVRTSEKTKTEFNFKDLQIKNQ